MIFNTIKGNNKPKPSSAARFGVMRVGAVIMVGIIVVTIVVANQYLQSDPELINENGSQHKPFSPLAQLQKTNPPSPTVLSTPIPTPIPVTKILPGSRHTFQTFNNCGPASLSMALSIYGETFSQQTLGNQLRPYQQAQGNNDDKSVTLKELALRAEEAGYFTYHRPAGTVELLQKFIAHDIPVITRTWLKPGEDIGHYRVIKGYDQATETLIQDDSLQGKDLTYSNTAFNDLWRAFNYEFLVLVPPDKKAVTEHILGELVDERTAWQHAKQLAGENMSAHPHDLYAAFNLSVAEYHLGNYPNSIAAYESVASRLPKRMLWYQLEPILAYYQTGQFDKVLHISQSIFDSHNTAYSELHWLRAKIFTKSGNVTAAEAALVAAKKYNVSTYWQANVMGVE